MRPISPLRACVATAVLAALAAAGWRALGRPGRVELRVPAAAPLRQEAPADLPGGSPCSVEEVARVGRRVTALLLASDGVLHMGTSGGAVVRLDLDGGGEPGAAALSGRERLVNALAEHDDLVWVATQAGLVALDGDRRVLALLPGEAVTALARAGAGLYAGTARGVFLVSAEDGAVPVDAAGPSGEPLRVTALAASGGRLWIGTSSGAYSLALAEVEAPLLARTARRHPIVSGEPPAESNAVTALAPLAGGVVVGTEDGGVARIGEDGGVAVARFAEAGANEVSPGAAAALAGPRGADAGVVLGTAGGLLLARARGPGLEVSRIVRGEISAVNVSEGGRLLAGGEGGAILSATCPAPQGRARQLTRTDPFVAMRIDAPARAPAESPDTPSPRIVERACRQRSARDPARRTRTRCPWRASSSPSEACRR